MRQGLLAAAAVLIALVAISTWLAAAEYVTIRPEGDYRARKSTDRVLTGPDADARRADMLRRAAFIVPAGLKRQTLPSANPLPGPVPSCRYLPEAPSGTTPKFDCVFPGGDTVKVKYGHDAEIHGETAATALLRRLGYGADTVVIVPRLRCYGCPRHPFLAMHLRRTFHLPFIRERIEDGYTDFEWVSVEHKFPAPAIETSTVSGWEWRELDTVDAPRAEVDAFRLIAAFLAHWDNKSENQRLVCLDGLPRHSAQGDGGSRRHAAPRETDLSRRSAERETDLSRRSAEREGGCERPLALIQDLGASFGPPKVNLARWRDLPVWYDRVTCTLSMRALPFDGATFEDLRISEEGRALAATRLLSISQAEIERLFADARFMQFQAGTDDERDLKAWVEAFTSRVRQIVEARCPG